MLQIPTFAFMQLHQMQDAPREGSKSTADFGESKACAENISILPCFALKAANGQVGGDGALFWGMLRVVNHFLEDSIRFVVVIWCSRTSSQSMVVRSIRAYRSNNSLSLTGVRTRSCHRSLPCPLRHGETQCRVFLVARSTQ